MAQITFEPTLFIIKDLNMDRVERVLQKSEATCLILNSIK